jgi:Xaa-Pro aminopeptidase
MQKKFSLYNQRRQALLEALKKEYPNRQGALLLVGAFEHERDVFRQESSFYYLTGLEEPATILLAHLNDSTTLYVPQYSVSRIIWAHSTIFGANKELLKEQGIDQVKFLGAACKGYSLAPVCALPVYESFLDELEKIVHDGGALFTLYPADRYSESASILDRLMILRPTLKKGIVDISPLVARMRRTKSQAELEEIYKAIDATMTAQEAAAQIIEPGKYEYQVQAGIEFIFTESGGSKGFPSIVGSGPNSVVLHYNGNKRQMKKGELVVVDIGAEFNYYCADLTRTYPVSGTFSNRQREVYNLVLDTQAYIENMAKPGYWIVNKDQQDKSLYHLAYKFLEEQGYAQYFTHGIGHFLGMDVHDVGDYTEPLKEGDVITIEPGIYIPEENLGIRIEDDYWVTDQGVACLSEDLPKNSYEIEEIMAGSIEEYEEE